MRNLLLASILFVCSGMGCSSTPVDQREALLNEKNSCASHCSALDLEAAGQVRMPRELEQDSTCLCRMVHKNHAVYKPGQDDVAAVLNEKNMDSHRRQKMRQTPSPQVPEGQAIPELGTGSPFVTPLTF